MQQQTAFLVLAITTAGSVNVAKIFERNFFYNYSIFVKQKLFVKFDIQSDYESNLFQKGVKTETKKETTCNDFKRKIYCFLVAFS